MLSIVAGGKVLDHPGYTSVPPSRFAACLPFTLKQEGGNSNNKHDPGGVTSRGVTQRVYDAWRRSKGLPTRCVWSAGDDEVAEIYQKQYWLPWCALLPVGVDLCFFDLAVNAGVDRAIRILQAALGQKVDGHIGVLTEGAIKAANDVALINRYSDLRLGFYRHLTIFKYFGADWTRREEACRKTALGMAMGAEASPVAIAA